MVTSMTMTPAKTTHDLVGWSGSATSARPDSPSPGVGIVVAGLIVGCKAEGEELHAVYFV